MKEQYMMEVEKALSIPRSKKKEILCDLQEIFASALEHGETEREVINRLGTPKEYAKNIEEQFGKTRSRQKKIKITAMISCVLGAIIFGGLFWYVQLHKMPENAIGGADSMTTIWVSSPMAFDISLLFMILGIGLLIFAGVLIIRYFRKK